MGDPVDPVIGLEEARRNIYRLSKGAFYGKGGPPRRLPVIRLSEKRKGIRQSAIEADLAARTFHPHGSCGR